LSAPVAPTVEQNPIEWFLPDGDGLVWHNYGDSSLLFNPRSGRTHLLEQWVVDVLEEFRNGPASVAALLERLGLAKEDGAVRGKIQNIISSLDQLGLILPVGP
jgi:PqqD family protein of HPr-rel-A system